MIRSNNQNAIDVCRVGVNLGTVEVRYRDLTIEAEYEVAIHGRPLPTLWNTLKTIFTVRKIK